MLEKINKAKSILKSQKGQGMVEYIVIIVGIAIACVVVVALFGKTIAGKFKYIDEEINKAKPVE